MFKQCLYHINIRFIPPVARRTKTTCETGADCTDQVGGTEFKEPCQASNVGLGGFLLHVETEKKKLDRHVTLMFNMFL